MSFLHHNDPFDPSILQTEYPWFLPTYLSYPYDIQRVDAVRYFILHKYGGIYIDLDMGCKKRLDFMRVANYTGPLTYPVGVSNDVMAARPGDVFMERAIHQLSRWNRWLFIKYVQVMFSTGPMFLTVQYAIAPRRIRNDVAVIPPPTYGKYDVTGDPAFYHLHGSSWHADDAAFVFWLDKYRGLLFAAGIAGVLVGLAAWELRRRRITQRSGARENFDLEKNF